MPMRSAVIAAQRSLHDCRKKGTRDRDFGHLKRDVATVTDDLGTNLDEHLPQTRERPVRDRLRRYKGAKEVPEVVGERMKLQTNGVSVKRAAH
jgi:hypothetical protein